MMLYILRHATAEEAGPGGDDATRRLTDRSREKMKSAAAGFKTLDIKLDAILTSPLPRASETASIVATAYGNTPAPQVLPELGAGVAPSEVVSALRPFAKLDTLMVVGHEPQLSALASLLLTGSPAGMHLLLRKGGCVALDLPARFERGGAELQWMMTHRQLRKLRK